MDREFFTVYYLIFIIGYPHPFLSKKTIDEIAKEAIRGDWGNGEERKQRLEEAGYDYDKVQKRVNELI